jgi:hypothetical protein
MKIVTVSDQLQVRFEVTGSQSIPNIDLYMEQQFSVIAAHYYFVTCF